MVCESCGVENGDDGAEVRMYVAEDDTYPLCGPCRPVKVTLTIENAYTDGYKETREVETAIPLTPKDDGSDETTAARHEWEDEYLFPHTGAGRNGDALYTVTITASADPALVGYVAEFGV